MAELITGSLAQVLAKGRDRFNKKIAMARRTSPSLDAALLETHLSSVLSPITDSLVLETSGPIDPIVEVLFDLSLELIARGYFDARYPDMTEAWRELLPKLPHLLLKDAHALAGAVTNSIYHLTAASKAGPRRWLDTMKTTGPRCQDIESFLEIGKIAAWCSGMAEYREEALRICRSIDPTLAYLSLGINPVQGTAAIKVILDKLDGDPWFEPAFFVKNPSGCRELSIVGVVGAFRGFGGEFLSPPLVVFRGGRFRLHDSQAEWTLYADCFGSNLRRNRPEEVKDTPLEKSSFTLDSHGKVTKGSLSAEFPRLAEASSYAANETTLAVTIPLSHSVYLISEVET